jgi:hypothetical protein
MLLTRRYTATEEELTAVFSKFGTLSRVHLAVDESKRAKGFAYVVGGLVSLFPPFPRTHHHLSCPYVS